MMLRLCVVREGSALVTALLGLLLVELAVAGVLYVSTQEALISRAYTQRLQARLGAESAVHAAFADWPADSLRTLLPGGVLPVARASGSLSETTISAEIERLQAGWFVVRGESRRLAAGPPAARAAALVSMLETAPLWRDFAAAVTTMGDVGVGPGASIDALHADAVPPPWNAALCPAAGLVDARAVLGALDRPALRIALPSTVNVDAASRIAGSPLIARDSALALTGAIDRIGPLSLNDVASVADRVESGSLHLAPVTSAGSCTTAAPGNWGDPSSPAAPCAAYLPLIYAPGDLEVIGGEGQGTLVVQGRLRLAPGTRFAGAILAVGGIDAGGTVIGALRAGPAPSTIDGSAAFNVCALWRAFTGATVFRRPYRRGARWWLPVF
jgi:hypothetical protein